MSDTIYLLLFVASGCSLFLSLVGLVGGVIRFFQMTHVEEEEE